MGSKVTVTDHHLSAVRSIVGSEFTDMDIIRALHMAKNDVTAAINIIFDTHTPTTAKPKPKPTRTNNCQPSLNSAPPTTDTATRTVAVHSKNNGAAAGGGDSRCCSDDWWFAGSGEMAGLSTSKGRTINSGDAVFFKFPAAKAASASPSPGKGFGRGRPAAGTCSEIVRFSTEQAGEVMYIVVAIVCSIRVV